MYLCVAIVGFAMSCNDDLFYTFSIARVTEGLKTVARLVVLTPVKAFEFGAEERERLEEIGRGTERRSLVSSAPARFDCIIHMPGPVLRSDWLFHLAFKRHSVAVFANIPHSKP